GRDAALPSTVKVCHKLTHAPQQMPYTGCRITTRGAVSKVAHNRSCERCPCRAPSCGWRHTEFVFKTVIGRTSRSTWQRLLRDTNRNASLTGSQFVVHSRNQVAESLAGRGRNESSIGTAPRPEPARASLKSSNAEIF